MSILFINHFLFNSLSIWERLVGGDVDYWKKACDSNKQVESYTNGLLVLKGVRCLGLGFFQGFLSPKTGQEETRCAGYGYFKRMLIISVILKLWSSFKEFKKCEIWVKIEDDQDHLLTGIYFSMCRLCTWNADAKIWDTKRSFNFEGIGNFHQLISNIKRYKNFHWLDKSYICGIVIFGDTRMNLCGKHKSYYRVLKWHKIYKKQSVTQKQIYHW
jgi:hypothetical protein